MAGDVELLDFVGVATRGGGIDGYLKEFAACVKDADEVLFIGLGGLVDHLERAGRIGRKELAQGFPGLFLGTVAGRGYDGEVQVVGKPAGEGGGVSCGKVFGDG